MVEIFGADLRGDFVNRLALIFGRQFQKTVIDLHDFTADIDLGHGVTSFHGTLSVGETPDV